MNKKIFITITLITSFLIIMSLFTFFKKSPVYNPEDASNITYKALPENIKTLLKKEDVSYILDIELQYQQKVGIIGNGPEPKEPMQINDDLDKFILEEARENGKTYSAEVISQVLLAEEVYLKQIGALE